MPNTSEYVALSKYAAPDWEILRSGWPDFLLVNEKAKKIIAIEVKLEKQKRLPNGGLSDVQIRMKQVLEAIVDEYHVEYVNIDDGLSSEEIDRMNLAMKKLGHGPIDDSLKWHLIKKREERRENEYDPGLDFYFKPTPERIAAEEAFYRLCEEQDKSHDLAYRYELYRQIFDTHPKVFVNPGRLNDDVEKLVLLALEKKYGVDDNDIRRMISQVKAGIHIGRFKS